MRPVFPGRMARMACGVSWLGGGVAAQVAGVPCPGQIKPTKGPQVLREGSPVPLNPCPGYEWAKTFGTAGVYDTAAGLDITSDGGAILLTFTHGGGATLVKVDAEGTVQGQKQYNVGNAGPGDTAHTSDGGFALAVTGD